MYKACPYCYGIHCKGEVCPKKPQEKRYGKKEANYIVKFRNSKAWQTKREQIRRRDGYMCRLCAAGYNNQPVRYEPSISVHHIESLSVAFEKRLDDDNLICLCQYHHDQAETGKIDKKLLKKLANLPLFSHPV